MKFIVPEKELRLLHDEYCRLVGELHLSLDRLYWWGQWCSHGWNIDDLRLVVSHIQTQIKKGKRYPGALRWSRLIQDSDNFSEELILAKAEKRNVKPAPSPRDNAVAAFRACDPAPPTADAKHVSQLINQLRAAAGMPLTKPNQ